MEGPGDGTDKTDLASWVSDHRAREVAHAMFQYQNEGRKKLSCAKPRSEEEMREIVRAWFARAMYTSKTRSEKDHRPPVKYPSGNETLTVISLGTASDFNIQRQRIQEFFETLVLRVGGDHKTPQIKPKYPQGIAQKVYDHGVLARSRTSGFIIHGQLRKLKDRETKRPGSKTKALDSGTSEDCTDLFTQSLMREIFDILTASPTHASIVLTFPGAYRIEPQDYRTRSIPHLLESFCIQLHNQNFFKKLELGFVTRDFLRTVRLGGQPSEVPLFKAMREIIINAALVIEDKKLPHQSITFIIQALEGFEVDERRELAEVPEYSSVIEFFRSLCSELAFSGLDRYLNLSYIMIYGATAPAAVNPHPNERQIFWNEIEMATAGLSGDKNRHDSAKDAAVAPRAPHPLYQDKSQDAGTLQPVIAIGSMDRKGNPDPQTLQRLQNAGVQLR